MLIRPVAAADFPRLLEIYTPYVTDTAITFEYEPPSLAEFSSRQLSRYPYLVAENDAGVIIGYAYAHPFHPRIAYQWTAEISIYLDQDARGQGCGGHLYDAVEAALTEMGMVSVYACCTAAQPGDPFCPTTSLHFHARRGYVEVGRFPACGYKFSRWYDMVWLEKQLAPRPAPIESPRWFNELDFKPRRVAT